MRWPRRLEQVQQQMNEIYQRKISLELKLILRNVMSTTFLLTNLKWQVVAGCYYWDKKVILLVDLNLNQ